MRLKFKYDEVKDRTKPKSDTEKETEPETEGVEILQYKTISSNRRLCFVQQDGKRKALSYGYLSSLDYDPEESIITLEYTTRHVVTIKGTNLEDLYEEIMHEIARVIICTDKRYEETEVEGDVSISEINIESKQDN
ncbi:MAG: hypothetical protein JST90_17300 [Bacteroidetes bacterium]|nr:hypothetical protein [Bacteroidota bacterium]